MQASDGMRRDIVSVDLGSRAYDIHIGENLLQEAGRPLRRFSAGPSPPSSPMKTWRAIISKPWKHPWLRRASNRLRSFFRRGKNQELRRAG